MKTLIISFLLSLLLTSCQSGKVPVPADGPDTSNHYDPVHGWKF